MAGIDSLIPPELLQQLLAAGQIQPETAKMVQDRYPPAVPQPDPVPYSTPEPPMEMPSVPEPMPQAQPAPPPPAVEIPEVRPAPALTTPSKITEEVLASLAKVESGGEADPNAARSPKGAVGKYQLTPRAVADVLIDRGADRDQTMASVESDPESFRKLATQSEATNKSLALGYLRLIEKQHPDWTLDQILAAYNGGKTRLAERGGDVAKMPPETRDYVPKVNEGLAKTAPSEAGAYSGDTVEPFEGAKTAYDKNQMSDAYGFGQKGITQGAQEQERIAGQLAQSREAYAAEQQALAEREAAMQERSMKLIEDARIAMQKASESYLSGSVDPNRLYANSSSGDKILAAIGIALGGLASGMAGSGKNSSLDLITGAIDKDIEQQKIELTKKGQYADMKRQEFNSLVSQFGSQESAWAAKRSILLQNAQQVTQSLAAQSGAAKSKTESIQAIQQLEVARQKELQTIEEKAAKTPEYETRALEQFYNGEIKLGEVPEAARVRVMPGIGTLVNEKDRPEAQKAAANLGKLNENINFLLKSRSANRGNMTDFELKAKVFSNAEELLLNYKDVYGLGALQPREVEIVKAIIGDPTSWAVKAGIFGQDEVEATLRNLQERSKRTTEIKLTPMIQVWDPVWKNQNDTSITARPR